MPASRPCTALICDRDPVFAMVLARLVSESGFEVVAQASNAIEALQLHLAFRPTLVVITDGQEGIRGIDAIGDLVSDVDPPEVVLLAIDMVVRDRAKRAGAYEAVLRGDSNTLIRVLDEIRLMFDSGERRKANDRRELSDRRKEQDWSKVSTERRVGGDRRKGPRRGPERSRDADSPLPNRRKPK